MNQNTCPNCGTLFIRKGTRVYCSLFCAVWSRVEKKSEDECWPWKGATGGVVSGPGYGYFRFDGVSWRAPRAVLVLAGHSMDDLDALHSCDNPICCNPKHLSPGSHTKNMQEMIERNRRGSQKFDKAPRATLTMDQAKAIKVRLEAGDKQVDIANDFNIKRSLVADISAGRSWKGI